MRVTAASSKRSATTIPPVRSPTVILNTASGERLAHWVSQGAQLSERVEKVVKAHKKASAAAAA